MEKEKNQAPEEPRWPDYKETLLARHPGTGEVQVVSDLRERGNRYEVHTVEPLTKNAPSFFEVAKSGAVAAFIRSFKSQSDKAVDFQFLKVPFNAVQDVVNDLLRLTQNPNDEKGLKALYDHRVDTMQLERVKYDHAEIPRAALRELGIDFDALAPQTREAMRMGLPVEELVPVTAEVMPGIKVSEMFSPRFYRNHNNELKVTLDAPLAVPEYEHEEYKMMFSTQEKAALERGGTLERLIKHKDPLTGEEEWCFVGKNAATNRLVFQPKREVATPAFTYNARISDAGRAELDNGGSALVEGCHYRNSDNHFSGKIHYDIHRGEYVTTPLRYERPYIPESIRKQITEEQQQALCRYESIAGDNIKSRNGKSFKGCTLQINRETNVLTYERREQQKIQAQGEEQRQTTAAQQSRGRSR